MREMKKYVISLAILATLLTSCASEFNRVYKTTDNDYKYEFAKECFARGKFTQAITCLLYTSPSPRDGLLSRMPSSA